MSELTIALGLGSCLLVNSGVGFYYALTSLRQIRSPKTAIEQIESYEAQLEKELSNHGLLGRLTYHSQFPGRGAAYLVHLLEERTR